MADLSGEEKLSVGDILLFSHGKLRVVSSIHGGGGEQTAEELTGNGEGRASEELSSCKGEQVKQHSLHMGEDRYRWRGA